MNSCLLLFLVVVPPLQICENQLQLKPAEAIFILCTLGKNPFPQKAEIDNIEKWFCGNQLIGPKQKTYSEKS